MKITEISLSNFRNIENMVFTPSDSINVIYGDNAQGKTNILEAIYLFTGFRSFRECTDGEMIRFDSNFFRNEINFKDSNREQNVKMTISQQNRKFLLNKVPLKTRSELIGNVRCTCFAPTHIDIIKGSPAVRRKFIDLSISQIKPTFAIILSKYKQLVEQKNAYLKKILKENCNENMLDIWDEQIAVYLEKIINERLLYLKKLNFESGKIHFELSDNTEKLEIKYCQMTGSSKRIIEKAPSGEEIRKAIVQSRKRDILNASTLYGTHRDDFEITINGKSVKMYGSQGQQRSAALSLKLGESEILSVESDDKSIILLDDVMSELDEKRQDYILNKIKNRQVFITCCDPNTVKKANFGKKIHIQNGKII